MRGSSPFKHRLLSVLCGGACDPLLLGPRQVPCVVAISLEITFFDFAFFAFFEKSEKLRVGEKCHFAVFENFENFAKLRTAQQPATEGKQYWCSLKQRYHYSHPVHINYWDYVSVGDIIIYLLFVFLFVLSRDYFAPFINHKSSCPFYFSCALTIIGNIL